MLTPTMPSEDVSRYPRDFARDRRLCREAGADFLFFPSDAQMYPQRDPGDYSTYVAEEQLSQGMEGAARPTHFRGEKEEIGTGLPAEPPITGEISRVAAYVLRGRELGRIDINAHSHNALGPHLPSGAVDQAHMP